MTFIVTSSTSNNALYTTTAYTTAGLAGGCVCVLHHIPIGGAGFCPICNLEARVLHLEHQIEGLRHALEGAARDHADVPQYELQAAEVSWVQVREAATEVLDSLDKRRPKEEMSEAEAAFRGVK